MAMRLGLGKRRGRQVKVAASVAAAVAACGTQPLQGHLFVSSVASTSQVIDALAVDFVTSQGDLTQTNVLLTIEPEAVSFVFESVPGSPNCVQLPQSGHVLLVAVGGEVSQSARVSITAHRDTCDGTPLDNAVWPTTTATPQPDASTDGSTLDGANEDGSDGAPSTDAGGDGG